jgi:hypothetical protein
MERIRGSLDKSEVMATAERVAAIINDAAISKVGWVNARLIKGIMLA